MYTSDYIFSTKAATLTVRYLNSSTTVTEHVT